MTRIVAGFAGSLRLAVPKAVTRPTSDRVREGIFSSLQSRDGLDGARVLDLYAGSGALGLEAISRGAVHATLVERNAKAARICRENAAAILKASPDAPATRIDVVARPVRTFLAGSVAEFSLALLDPPYDLTEAELGTVLKELVPKLADSAEVVLERSSRSSEPSWPHGLLADRRKNYGDTTVWFARMA